MTGSARVRLVLAAGVAAALVASRAVRAEDDPPAADRVPAPVVRFPDGAPAVFGLPVVGEVGAWDEREPDETAALAEEAAELFGTEIEAEGGALAADEQSLLLEGPPAAADRLRLRVDELTRALDAAVVVEVSVVRLPASAPRDAGRDALVALVRSGAAESLFGERLTVHRGQTVLREAVERRPFLASFTPEVAQDASITTPEAKELCTGKRLAVHARTLPSGRTAVTVSLHAARATAPARRETTSAGSFDLPEVRFVALTAPFLLAEGATGTARVPDPFGDGALLVRATLAQGPAKAAGPWRVADLHVAAGSRRPSIAFVAPGWVPEIEYEEEPADDDLGERLDAAGRRVRDAGIGATPLTRGLLAVRAADATAVEELLDGDFRTGTLRRTSVRLPSAKLGAATWYDPLDGRVTGDVPADAGRAAPEIELPLRADTPTLLLVGTWRRLVAGVSAEIAQGAVAALPIAMDHFEGEALLAQPLPAAAGRPVVADVRHRALAVVERGSRPALLRVDVGGTARNDDATRVETMTAAESRQRLDVGRDPVASIRSEGADAVLESWSVE